MQEEPRLTVEAKRETLEPNTHLYIYTLYMVSENMGWFGFSSPLQSCQVGITLLAVSLGILGAE